MPLKHHKLLQTLRIIVIYRKRIQIYIKIKNEISLTKIFLEFLGINMLELINITYIRKTLYKVIIFKKKTFKVLKGTKFIKKKYMFCLNLYL